MAAHGAWYSSVNGLFSPFWRFQRDLRIVPACTYTDPEIARVGDTEASAREKGLEVDVTHFDLEELDRAIVDGETPGFVRVLTEKGSDRILGATIMGPTASTMLLEFVSAMKNGKGLNSILNTIHVYPSFGEANKYAAGLWKKAQVNPKHLDLLRSFFTWRRG
jgi:pyruvate/2-oxoglutarate dehydrogenase complex dihydrolipoamide dehydrogenase (E3) component